MVYMGSKNRYAKYIIPIIQNYIDKNNITVFIDCFCGSASIVDQIKCDKVIANDLSPTLISLHKQAQSDFSKIPETCTKDDWNKAKAEWLKILEDKDYLPNLPLYKIGAIEWYTSFARGGFPKGYIESSKGRNYYKEGRKNHQKQAEKENYKKIKFINLDYRNINLDYKNENILLYCDAPYKETTPYGINKLNKFDYNSYYNWLRKTSKKFPIFISEQEMPDDFNPPIWEKETNRTVSLNNKCKSCERLYFHFAYN